MTDTRTDWRSREALRGSPAPMPGTWTVVDVLQQATCGHRHRTQECAIACRERQVRRARRIQGTRAPRVILDLARGSSSGWVLVDPPDGWGWRIHTGGGPS